jgi:hypothetical protein
MALVVKDRVQETSTTTGTGTFTLLGAVTGFQTFSSSIGNTNTTYYTIQNGTEWEVGIGTVSASALSRDTVLESSNGGSLVDFSAGSKFVFCTYPAEKSVYYDASNNVNIDITGNAATVTNGLYTTDIGSTVQAYDAATTKNAATQTLTNKTISGSNNTLSNIGNSSLTNSAITINGTSTSLGGSISVGTVTSVETSGGLTGGTITSTGTISIADGGVTPAKLSTGSPSWNTSGNLSFNSGYGSVATAYGCRAWVNFNGQGTVAIRASGNVTSITDNGTGSYTVNITNAMPDANYSVVLSIKTPYTDANTNETLGRSSDSNPSTSSFRIYCNQLNSPSTAVDVPYVCAAVFR